jgi:hypothetical protein
MSNALRQNIEHLASELATAIVNAIRESTLADILATATTEPVKRGRGRPRKHPAPAAAVSAPAAAPAATVKRGRGRPRKHPVAAPAAKASAPAKTAKRGRGRPRKNDRAKVLATILTYLKAYPKSSGEKARKALSIEKHLWSSTVGKAVRDGKVKKEGDRRSTVYWLA